MNQTNVEFGKMFLTLLNSEKEELTVLKFVSNGKGKVVGTFSASKEKLIKAINDDLI